MCGICGIFSNDNSDLNVFDLELMNNSMAHRGPDANGLCNEMPALLGHRRLSIIDLSESANQPMVSFDKELVIVFNGEIYNYLELKEQLEKKHHVFKTNSDTEVILNAFKEWGYDSFNKLNGMFAFSLYNKVKKEIVLVRDHSGIKPLYYSIKGKKLLFASEIKAFKAYDSNWKADENWGIYFLSFGFIPSPFTTLKDVFMLPKGSYLKFSAGNNRNAQITEYHKFNFTSRINNEKEAIDQVRETFIQSVKRHLISDAPLGIFLSGGIDSSLVALTANFLGYDNIKTLSVTFKESAFNEEPFQKIVLDKIKHCEHHNYEVDGNMFFENLDDIFQSMDQPSWDGVNSYFISKCAKDAGLKTVLSGLGGDELFGGYPSFERIKYLKLLSGIPKYTFSHLGKFNHNYFQRLNFLNLDSPYNHYLFFRGAFTPNSIKRLTGYSKHAILSALEQMEITDYPSQIDENLAAFLEKDVYMENQLLKDSDYMSMRHSLELRVPFLDKELVELMHNIDYKIKFNFSQPKYLLTKAFQDILPGEIVFRKKQGFTFPFSIWLKKDLKLLNSLLPKNEYAYAIRDQFLKGRIHWSKMWALIIWKKFAENQEKNETRYKKHLNMF